MTQAQATLDGIDPDAVEPATLEDLQRYHDDTRALQDLAEEASREFEEYKTSSKEHLELLKKRLEIAVRNRDAYINDCELPLMNLPEDDTTDDG